MIASMPIEHEELMQQHLRDENLPEAFMPAVPINKVLKGQKALVTGSLTKAEVSCKFSSGFFDLPTWRQAKKLARHVEP